MFKKIFSLILTMAFLMMSLTACTGKSALKKADESIGDETGNNVTDLESDAESVAASSKVNSAAASSQKVTSKAESKAQSSSKNDNSSEGVSSIFKSINDVPLMVLEGESVPFTVAGSLEFPPDDSIKFRQAIVKSWEQLLSLYEETIYQPYGKKEKIFLLQNTKDKYSKDFFNDSALILLNDPLNSSSFHRRFDALAKKDGKIYAGILQWIPGEGDNPIGIKGDTSGWSLIAEVKKSDVLNIENLEIVIKNKKYIK